MSDKSGNFGKIFESLFERSLVGKGAIVFAVMGYVIAKQKPVGKAGEQRMEVTLNPSLIGPILGEKRDLVEEAIEVLCSEDENTHTPDEKGRRLVKIGAFDYWVVNGMKYRDMRKEEERREQNRQAQKTFRAKKGKSASRNGEAEHLRLIEAGATEEQLQSHLDEHQPPQREQEMPVSEQPSANPPDVEIPELEP